MAESERRIGTGDDLPVGPGKRLNDPLPATGVNDNGIDLKPLAALRRGDKINAEGRCDEAVRRSTLFGEMCRETRPMALSASVEMRPP